VSTHQHSLEIQPLSRPPDCTISVPGSKSLSNRALLVAALAPGKCVISGALFSDDTRYMAGALRQLGISVSADEERERFEVEGTGGDIPASEAELFVGNSGTTARFITSYVALGHGRYRVDGVPRMRQRPIQPLLDALGNLGVRAYSETGSGCPPVVVEAGGARGGSTPLSGAISSQYLTALLLAGPYMAEGLEVRVTGELVSRPYVDLTIGLMRDFGVEVEQEGDRRFRVAPGQRYAAREYAVEPDASAASYFFAAAALTGGRVRIEGLGRNSAQGDVHFADVLARMGCDVSWEERAVEVRGPGRLRGIDVDLNGMSDTAQTLAAIAPFASGPVCITGIAHNRAKETDRVAAVATELRRLGARVEEREDGLTIYPSEVRPSVVETYDDHRMAMSFAVTGLVAPGIRIQDPACVNKTFPAFFERLAELRT
jgi:3-phosphoshikimate 1-carboxyvinyltransferase